jgi:membrane protein involved in colicin uptake
MAPETKMTEKAVSKPEKTSKKVKKSKKAAAAPEAEKEDTSLGLFKGKKSELDDVFGKGVSLQWS